MQKRDLLGYLALAFMALAGFAALYYFLLAPHTFRIALPPSESEPAQLFNAMSAALKRDHSQIRLAPVYYDSDESIVAAMEAGKVDLAVARTDRPLPGSSLGVAQVHEFVTLVLLRPSVQIESFAALKGHRIGELTRANTGAGVLLELASFSDLKRDELDIVGIKSPSAIFATVMEHNLDALLIVAPRGSAIIGEAIKALTSAFGAPPLLLALKETKAIATRIAALDEGEIAIGELSANPPLPAVASPTLTFPALLVARRQISDNSIRDLTKQIFDVRNSISALYPAASRLTSLDTERGGSFAVHPGAAIYYDASETSILERYSDMLWLLLFGFSTVVSAIVWFLRRLFPRQTELLREEHAELIELLQHVRATKSVADLDRAEKRIDEIVSGISKLSFRGMIDEEQQPAFELIISRIEKVIDDRRRSVEDLENQVSADPEK